MSVGFVSKGAIGRETSSLVKLWDFAASCGDDGVVMLLIRPLSVLVMLVMLTMPPPLPLSLDWAASKRSQSFSSIGLEVRLRMVKHRVAILADGYSRRCSNCQGTMAIEAIPSFQQGAVSESLGPSTRPLLAKYEHGQVSALSANDGQPEEYGIRCVLSFPFPFSFSLSLSYPILSYPIPSHERTNGTEITSAS
jgi:hypothetical protein